MRSAAAWKTIGCVLLVTAACSPYVAPEGVLGEERLVYFIAPDDAYLRVQLITGSHFDVAVQARVTAEDAELQGAELRSSDPSILELTPAVGEGPADSRAHLTLHAPGEAYLELVGDEGVIDKVLLRSAVAERLELLDPTLGGGTIDTRLPEAVGVLVDQKIELALQAQDRCGGALIDGAALALGTQGALHAELIDGRIVLELPPDGRGEHVLTIAQPTQEAVTLDVTGIAPGDIDGLRLEIASGTGNAAELWGRVFAGEVEVLGGSFSWAASPRVTLSERTGPTTTATIFVPAAEEPLDERPATVELTAYELQDAVDLFALTTDQIQTGRVAVEEPASSIGPSCWSEPCNPYTLGLVGLCSFRVIPLGRRRRRASRRGDQT